MDELQGQTQATSRRTADGGIKTSRKFFGSLTVERGIDGRIKKLLGVVASEVVERLFGKGLVYRVASDHAVSFKRFREDPSVGYFIYEKF